MANRKHRGAASGLALLLVLGGIAAPGASRAAGASPCVPVRAAADPATLPAPWRAALDALIAATAAEGLPWSCPGGTIALSLAAGDASGALTVTDATGHATTRPVASPAEVGPTGKALLAALPVVAKEAPVAAKEAPIAPAAPGIDAPPREVERAAPPAREARLVVGLMVGPRVSGPDTTAWMSGALRGAIPFGPWWVGLWTRVDFPIAATRPPPAWFSMSAVSLGLRGGRSFSIGPLALEASFLPSVAVVAMEETRNEAKKHPEGARIALRIGAELASTVPINAWLRGRVALDGEVAPAESSLIFEGFPRVPRYTLGLSLGLEALIQ